MSAYLFVGLFVIAVFAFELGRTWWRENEWRRQWRKDRDDDR